MKLFTKQINDKLINQYRFGSDLSKQKAVAKIFNPYGKGRWFLLNSDPADPDYLWAIVEMNGEIEVGSVSRKELESIRLTAFRLGLERDLGFTPINALELYNGLRQGKFYKQGGYMEDGGKFDDDIAESNNEMLRSNIKEIKHHQEEIEKLVNKDTEVEAWVIAKSERAANDLADITHYIDGREMESGGYMAEGGVVSKKSFDKIVLEITNALKEKTYNESKKTYYFNVDTPSASTIAWRGFSSDHRWSIIYNLRYDNYIYLYIEDKDYKVDKISDALRLIKNSDVIKPLSYTNGISGLDIRNGLVTAYDNLGRKWNPELDKYESGGYMEGGGINMRKTYTEKQLKDLGYSKMTVPNQKIYEIFFKKGNEVLELRSVPVVGAYAIPKSEDTYRIKDVKKMADGGYMADGGKLKKKIEVKFHYQAGQDAMIKTNYEKNAINNGFELCKVVQVNKYFYDDKTTEYGIVVEYKGVEQEFFELSFNKDLIIKQNIKNLIFELKANIGQNVFVTEKTMLEGGKYKDYVIPTKIKEIVLCSNENSNFVKYKTYHSHNIFGNFAEYQPADTIFTEKSDDYMAKGGVSKKEFWLQIIPDDLYAENPSGSFLVVDTIKDKILGVFDTRSEAVVFRHEYLYKNKYKNKKESGGYMDKGGEIGDSGIITDKSSLYKGKMATIVGKVDNMWVVKFLDNGNERTSLVSKKGIDIIDDDNDDMAYGGMVHGKFSLFGTSENGWYAKETKSGEWVKPTNRMVWESKDEAISDLDKGKFSYSKKMAAGGEIGGNYTFKNEFGSFTSVKIMPIDSNYKLSKTHFSVKVDVRKKDGENEIIQSKPLQTYSIEKYEDFVKDLLNRGAKKMAGGGMTKKVTFDDKVKAISSRLKGAKVSSKYQKKYGKKYDKSEALEAAKRIAGAIRSKSKK